MNTLLSLNFRGMCMKKNKYEVTLLVASYNPKWYALKRTLCSALNQKKIMFQIVIADDGSKVNYYNEIVQLFDSYNYRDYKFIKSDVNNGTCINIYNGLLCSEGEYIKTIGPGDCLYDELTLYHWVNYAKDTCADICFGDSIFFERSHNTENIISKRRYPQNVSPYLKEKYLVKEGIFNYVLLNDAVWGSNFLTKYDVMLTYMEQIVGKIKYAEDMIYRMMICDGKKMNYYPENVIWYEYGSGISTSGESKWDSIILEEKIVSNRLICENNIFKGINRIRFSFVINCLSKRNKSWIKYIMYPSLIKFKIKKDSIHANTDKDVDIDLFYKICNEKD